MTSVLIVEDNEMNRDMLSRRLRRAGFKVSLAEHGPGGIEAARRERPDLILMDVALGEMDGWEATRILKADVDTAAIPVIALTAHSLASDRDRSVAVGCADFDTKPVDLARLLNKMRACLDASQQHL
jgi:CheY-like chemotaxis protein